MKTKYIQMLQKNIGGSMKGKIAGFGAWLDGRVSKISEAGDLEMEFVVREEMLNPMGNLHGGAVAAIIDEILGFQLFLKSEEDSVYVSMTLNIDFLRAATAGDVITAIPQVVKSGRKIANVTCVLKNTVGKEIAQSTANFMRIV